MEYFVQDGLDLLFVDGKGATGISTVFDLTGTEPFAVLLAKSV